jgi:hypothetical protein
MLGQHPTTAHRRSAIDGRTTPHPAYMLSQQKRKLVEQGFGWMKTVGGLRKLHHRDVALVRWVFTFNAAAYNLVRMHNLLARRSVSNSLTTDSSLPEASEIMR